MIKESRILTVLFLLAGINTSISTAAFGQNADSQISGNSESNRSLSVKDEAVTMDLSRRLESSKIAIDKFKQMGVGVSLFEQSWQNIKSMLAEGKQQQANEALERLNNSLAEQQKRFYAGKLQSWHADNQRRIAAKAGVSGTGSKPQALRPSAELSRGAHGVLSKKKGDYTPLIYPIAR